MRRPRHSFDFHPKSATTFGSCLSASSSVPSLDIACLLQRYKIHVWQTLSRLPTCTKPKQEPLQSTPCITTDLQRVSFVSLHPHHLLLPLPRGRPILAVPFTVKQGSACEKDTPCPVWLDGVRLVAFRGSHLPAFLSRGSRRSRPCRFGFAIAVRPSSPGRLLLKLGRGCETQPRQMELWLRLLRIKPVLSGISSGLLCIDWPSGCASVQDKRSKFTDIFDQGGHG
jgi:hypothetical protein